MIPVTVRRVLLAEHRVDFRRQMTGLLAEAYRIGADPYDGDCVYAEGRVMPSAAGCCSEPRAPVLVDSA